MPRGATLAFVLALMLPALLGGGRPPSIVLPDNQERYYSITGGSLAILSHPDYREFQYRGGVTFNGDGLELHATSVDIEVSYGDTEGRGAISLPEPDPGELERDPSGTAAQLAREIYLPDPNFSPEMLRVIRASGGVSITTENITLNAPELASYDGGNTWRTSGRSSLAGTDMDSGGQLELAADSLSYNTVSGLGGASGNIEALLALAESPPIELDAQHAEFNAQAGTLTAGGQLLARSGGLVLCCGTLSVDLEQRLAVATDSPRITHEEQGLTLTALAVSYGLDDGQVLASGNVVAVDEVRQATLAAGQVAYDPQARVATATGGPRLEHGSSFYAGSSIRATQLEGGKLIVEVEGPQGGRIDLGAIQGAAGAGADGGEDGDYGTGGESGATPGRPAGGG